MFLKETDCQDSAVGKIPKEWEAKATEELFSVETGTTPSTREEAYWKDGTVNWLTPTDLSKLKGKLRITGSERKISEKALKETNLTLMSKGSIILSTRAPVGYVATLEEDATFNQGCKGLIPKNVTETLSDFYSYYISSKKAVLQNLSGGSTFLELSKKRLEKFSMPFPPISEQRAIVGVLNVVDYAVELADQVIAKTERLKKGLMQQLLTHGIGHKIYIRSEDLGVSIPQEWKVVELCEVLAERKTNYGIYKEKKEYGSGIRILKISDVFSKDIYAGEECQRVPLSNSEYVENEVKKADILLAVASLKKEGIGKVMYVDHVTEKTAFDHNTINIRANQGICYPKFLFYALKANYVRGVMMSYRTVVGTTFLKASIVDKLKIPLPSLDEQHKIAEILSAVDRKLSIEKMAPARILRVKQELMNLLLTGKVRIKVG